MSRLPKSHGSRLLDLEPGSREKTDGINRSLTGVRLGQALISVAGAVILARYGFKFFFILIGVLPMVWLLPWNLFLKK